MKFSPLGLQHLAFTLPPSTTKELLSPLVPPAYIEQYSYILHCPKAAPTTMHITPIFGAVLAALFITTTMAHTSKDGCPDCQRRLERCTKVSFQTQRTTHPHSTDKHNRTARKIIMPNRKLSLSASRNAAAGSAGNTTAAPYAVSPRGSFAMIRIWAKLGRSTGTWE